MKMLFSDLIDYLKNEKNFNIILNCSTDLHEIRDVELLDGTQTGYATDIVYFGYPDVLSPDMQPSQCILVRGENYLFPYSCTDRATVQAKELFAVFNAAKQFLQTHEQVSLYEELVRKGHSSHSLDEVINSASIKLGYSLVFCDKKFRILSYSTSIPVTDKLWKKNIERGYCTYDFIKNVMSLEAVQGASASIEAVEVSCPESPYRKCSSKVFLNGVQVGFVLMIENNIPFTAEHLAAMSDVSRAISSVVGHYHPELFQYTSADQQLLEALLIGTPADILADSISHLRVSDAMYALCIQPKTFLKENKLKCHYCGYETNALTVCPECGGKNIRYFGTGTQKLEEQIKTMFPDATTIRMDIDTVTKKNSHEDILNSFKKDGIDILIGTQMVVKGHDFPNVTLVGVIAADSSLNIDDYRAHERTFQTLTQVAGRAGRGKDKGRVIIQTYNPDAFCIQYSQKQDYKLFYDTEIHLRKQLRYPPFCDIILIGVSSKSYKELEETSNKIYESLKAKIHTEKLQILLYKPVPAPIDRIKNKFRWRIIVKCIVGEPIINAIDDTVKNAGNKNTKNDTRIVVDVNPSNML